MVKKKTSVSLVLQKHRTVKIIFLQMLEERHNMIFSSLTHLYFSVVKGPKTEDSILSTSLFLYFEKVKNKKKSKYFNDETANIFGRNDYWMGTDNFQAVKQNAHVVPKSNNPGGLRVDRMQVEFC